jgi:ubiquinone/menaquinone biosynthesis C-methylase UbiE
MAVSRYELVRQQAAGKRVLEVACGSGQGLNYVGHDAAWIVGSDITAGLLLTAQSYSKGAIPLVQLDAHALPFAPESFDIIQVHEAVYYMSNPAAVFDECRRVLREGGALVVSSINPEWTDFNPSPHATVYLPADELRATLSRSFSSVEILFGFPVPERSASRQVVSLIKRAAIRFNLIPRTMVGKTLLKRVFLGPLVTMTPDLTALSASIDRPVEASDLKVSQFRVIYAIATR